LAILTLNAQALDTVNCVTEGRELMEENIVRNCGTNAHLS